MSRSRPAVAALAVLFGALTLIGGCQSSDPAPPVADDGGAGGPGGSGGSGDSGGSGGNAMPPSDAKYDGPAFTVDVLQMESFPVQYAVNYEVTVNSGGWKLIKDREMFEGGVLTVWLTLEAPGKGEIVTMALETLEGRFAAGTTKVERVEIHVKRTRRGEDNTSAAHRLAARWPTERQRCVSDRLSVSAPTASPDAVQIHSESFLTVEGPRLLANFLGMASV